MEPVDASVIGSGPNGLSAAIVLARAGLRVRVHEAEPTPGGGARSAELTLPGFVHDVCSAIHPMAAASPFFAELELSRHGVEWIHPPIALAHPLDDGTAITLVRSLDETAAGLGGDGPTYRRLIEPLATNFRALAEDVLGPVLHVPSHVRLLARFGLHAMLSVERLCRSFEGVRARALFAGLAAHSFSALDAPFTASFALVFAAVGHAAGWPLIRGGTQRLTEVLVEILRAHGGELVLGDRVDSIDQLAPSRAWLFDTAPAALERIAGQRFPDRYRRALRRFRHGPGAFKLDYALSGPVPWRAPECRLAGTVHVGGTFAEIAAGEAQVLRGEHPERPFVLVAQQSLADPTRAPPGMHTLWAYCHVPHGSTVDMTAAVEGQLERFAPGFRELVLARTITTTRELEARNANCIGGDIAGGANDGWQLFVRPRLAIDPYATPARGMFLCSASTPPGAGVHGMCGYHAARSALRHSFGR